MSAGGTLSFSAVAGWGLRVAREEPGGAGRNVPPMKEESQLEEMRAALRGDRERADRRRRAQEPPFVPAAAASPPEPLPEFQPPARASRLRSLFGR